MDSLLQQFDICFSNPEDYLDGSVKLKKSCLSLNKELFSYCHDKSGRFPKGPLSILHTKGFDNEQIWEQIQLLNEPTLKFAKKKIKEITEMKISSVDAEDNDCGDGAVLSSEHDESGDESEESIDGHTNGNDVAPKQSARTQDVFFNLAEMNRFLQNEDLKYESRLDSKQNGDNDIDLFREMSSEEEDNHLMYDDFFDPPIDDKDNSEETNSEGENEIGTDEAMDESEQELSNDNEMDDLSSHQKQQQKVINIIIFSCVCIMLYIGFFSVVDKTY